MEESRHQEELTSQRVRMEREAAAERVLAGLHAEQSAGTEEARAGQMPESEGRPATEARAVRDNSSAEQDRARATQYDARAEQSIAAPVAESAAVPATAAELEPAQAPAANNVDPNPFTERASLSIRRGVMPTPLRGSLALLERQDERLKADGLEPIQDEADLTARIAHHLLTPLPLSEALTVNPELPMHHRYCRPWTARFLADLARAHEAAFHRPLEVSSAVRPVAYQEQLTRINGNAAPAEGAIFSPHEMGATVDLAKKQMSLDEIAWMRRHLLALELEGKIDVEEEFDQACFHISVYRSYFPEHAARPSSAHSGRTRRSANRTQPVPAVDAQSGQ